MLRFLCESPSYLFLNVILEKQSSNIKSHSLETVKRKQKKKQTKDNQTDTDLLC